MKVSVFVYTSLIFGMTLFVSVSDYIQRFNTNRTLSHIFHRSLRNTMEQDLLNKRLIEDNFSTLFLKHSPENIDYKIQVVDFNSSPKILRIHVEANHQGDLFIYDETLVEEVIHE